MHSPSTSLHTDGPTALGGFPSQLHSHVIHVTPEPGELLTGEPRGQPGTVAAAASLTRRGGFVPANRATTAVIGRRGLFFVKEKTFLTWTSTPGLALQSRRGACFLSGGACTPDFQAFWLSRGDPHLWGSAEARMPGPGRIQSHSWV